jgi:NAD(P)-dependent dehydrogenase (short-subunit alcohol dehydrogenase family)
VKVVLLGATRGIGRALARLLAERGDALFLLGRDPEELRRSAADLEARGASGPVGQARCDLLEPAAFGAALDAADAALGAFETFVVSAAHFATQEELEADPEALERTLRANFTNTVLLCELVRRRLLARGGGRLCVFSSVAGDRGRPSVGLYGSTKAGLTHYLESLDLRYRDAGLRATCVKPGFVRTSMTEGLRAPPFAGDAEPVARRVLRALDRGWPTVYAPAAWRTVMGAIRLLPRAALRRIPLS